VSEQADGDAAPATSVMPPRPPGAGVCLQAHGAAGRPPYGLGPAGIKHKGRGGRQVADKMVELRGTAVPSAADDGLPRPWPKSVTGHERELAHLFDGHGGET